MSEELNDSEICRVSDSKVVGISLDLNALRASKFVYFSDFGISRHMGHATEIFHR